MTTLDKIVDYKKDELQSIRRKVSLQDVRLKAQDAEEAKDFLGGFSKDEINIIAEVKKASPSAGIIREDFNALDIAHIYQDNSAKALSILTDENFFQGSLSYLEQIKKSVRLPCLRKDFTLDEYHLFEARGASADAVLLIVAILDDYQLKDYYQIASELGMSALVEVHDENELNRALAIAPKIIGVNNRDLKTFVTDVKTSQRLAQNIPDSVTQISESGLNHHETLVQLRNDGFNGFLIGESLMRQASIGDQLKRLIQG